MWVDLFIMTFKAASRERNISSTMFWLICLFPLKPKATKLSHLIWILRCSVCRRAHRARHDAARGEDGRGRGALWPSHRRRLRPLRRGRRRQALKQGKEHWFSGSSMNLLIGAGSILTPENRESILILNFHVNKLGRCLMMMIATFRQRQTANLYHKWLTSTVNSRWCNVINFALASLRHYLILSCATQFNGDHTICTNWML